MASNFRIVVHRRNGHLHLRLMGDFDGSSAYELVHVLEKQIADPPAKIWIHSAGLQNIHPFGLAIFQNNFPVIKNHFIGFIFDGPKSAELIPWKNPDHEKCKIYFAEETHGQNNRNAVLQTQS